LAFVKLLLLYKISFYPYISLALYLVQLYVIIIATLVTIALNEYNNNNNNNNNHFICIWDNPLYPLYATICTLIIYMHDNNLNQEMECFFWIL